jgi:hypothetical protein
MQGFDPQGSESALGITTSKVLKTGDGVVCTINVVVAGAGCTVNDCATTGAAAAGNQMLAIPNAVGPVNMSGFPFFTGLCIIVAGSATIDVAYS